VSQFDVTWERVRLEVERLRVSGDGSAYDPRLEMASRYALQGERLRAEREAEAIQRDNPAAGYIAWESLKRLYLAKGETFWAQSAADEAAKVLKRLNQG
jgi:hypothetical protein